MQPVILRTKRPTRAKRPRIEEVAMDKWECTVCGYIYDPDVGDPENGVEPGTAFEDLPEDWVCPVCGAPVDMFEKL